MFAEDIHRMEFILLLNHQSNRLKLKSRSKVHIWSLYLMTASLFSIAFTVNAKDNRELSYELFTKGKSLYKTGDYTQAEKIFNKSLRLVQDHQTMYYRALAVGKNTVKSCEDQVSCWQNYLDFCDTDKNSNCVGSWLKKARKHHQSFSDKCSANQAQVSSEQANSRTPSQDSKGSGASLRMTTSFQCRIKSDRGKFQSQRICNGEYFQEDDQVRFEIKSAQTGFLYVIVHNDSGQLQLVYPEPSTDNRLVANKSYKIPSDPYFKGWWSVDDQKDVKERITLILTKVPDSVLEHLRGTDLKPEQAKAYLVSDKVVNRSLTSWKEHGSNAEVQGDGISIQSVGDLNRVVAQYYFNHE